MEILPLSLIFILAGILVILLAMPFGVYPCKFSKPKEWKFGEGLIATVLGYSLIILGIIMWLFSL